VERSDVHLVQEDLDLSQFTPHKPASLNNRRRKRSGRSLKELSSRAENRQGRRYPPTEALPDRP
jgi:hypothetical protein